MLPRWLGGKMLLRLSIFWALTATALAQKSSGCKDKPDPLKTEELKDNAYDFKDRAVLVSYPPKYQSNKPASVIIAFHDREQTPIIMQETTLLSDPGVNPKSLVFYVSPKDHVWMTDPGTEWKPDAYSFDSDGDDPENDIFYTSKLIEHIKDNYCVNTRRMFIVGHGTGAGMARQIACQPALSRKIAAFATVGAAMFKSDDSEDRFWGTCMIGRRPIPILNIHGEVDEYWPSMEEKRWNTSAPANALPARDYTDQWRILNRCGEPKGEGQASVLSSAVFLKEYENGQRSESLCYGGSVLKTTYRCGHYRFSRPNDDFQVEEKDLGKTDIVHLEVLEHGHKWPRVQGSGGEKEFHGKTVMPDPGMAASFDATTVIMNFFAHHKMPSDKVVHAQAKELLIERGARRYDDNIMGREPRSAAFYGRTDDYKDEL